jgi:metallo-beta-lactamase class B
MSDNLRRFTSIATVAVCLAMGGPIAGAVDEAAIAKLRAQADAIASQPGEDLHNIAWLCGDRTPRGGLRAGPDPDPAPIFDNLYFVGTGTVTSWAIKTSAGIILFDTLDNSAEANQYIVQGFKKLGLDLMSIKYIVLTHAHGDHYGGAKLLQEEIPGVRVLMGAADWDGMANGTVSGGGTPPPPKRDMSITDGQKLALGDETVTLYLTPGHTPGTVSAIIPVTDHGKPMKVALWGGMPFSTKESEAAFLASIKRFRQIMAAENVVGRLSNHALWDNSVMKLYLRNNNQNGPSPYIETQADMARYAQIQDLCLQAQHIRLTTQ